jgi:hypothetical protein
MRARWTGEATGVPPAARAAAALPVPGSLPRVIQAGVPVVLAEKPTDMPGLR